MVEEIKKRKIGVFMGGKSTEREISLKTGNAVLQSLLKQGLDAVAIDPAEKLIGQVEKEKINVAFLALHGEGGEDGVIQGFLESAGIPYTGSDVCSSAVSMDKNISKIIFEESGIPTPGFFTLTGNEENPEEMMTKKGIGYPVVVKPSSGGSTIGISIAEEKEMLEKAIESAFSFYKSVIVEEFIEGRDLTVGILSGQVLPVVEMKPESGFYDYEAKYEKGKTKYLCPAPLTEEEDELCRHYSLMAYKALRCAGAPRVDIRMNAKGKMFVLEVNTIPGMTETSLLPMAAKEAGINFETLVLKILEDAIAKKK